jgi:uncharacterized protein
MSCQSFSTAIVKPVNGQCNLSCSYCYVLGLEKCSTDYMQPETLKATIDFFCCNQDDVEFIWHGGEPLLAGIDFFHYIVEFQREWKQQGKRIANFVQTNATLITPEWVQFFVENDFIVGVSLDGPKEFHDKVRHYSTNIGSFDNVMRGINLLRKNDIFNGVICCISSVNRQYPQKLFDFFVAEGLKKLKFSRVKDMGHCNNMGQLVISPAEYYDFMIKIFDLWLELDDSEIEIRDIQSVVSLLLGGNRRECINMGNCDRFVTVYSDGSIYSCDSFPKVNELRFGTVFEIQDPIRPNPQLQIFQDLIEKRKEYCHSCKWYSICQGGCAKDYYEQLDSIRPLDKVCKSRKKYLEYISVKISSYNIV